MEGRKIIKWMLMGILVATIVGYSCFVLYDYFRGPRIIILSPESGFSTTTPVIAIVGHAIHVSVLTINGVAAPYDLKGNFESQLILAEGYNIMKVTAKDHYGRTAEKTIELTLAGKVKNGCGYRGPTFRLVSVQDANQLIRRSDLGCMGTTTTY